LKGNPLSAGRFALHRVATAAAFTALLMSTDAQALGLGRLNVQSALGEALRAEIDISSLTPEEAAGLQVKVASPETYRAAGVDYNSVLPSTAIVLQRRADGRPYLKIGSDRAVQEPFVDVILELSWSTGRLVREYTLLFDPPRETVAPAPITAPVIAVPVVPAPVAAPAPAVVAQPKAAAEAPAEAPVAKRKPGADSATVAKGSAASKKSAPAPAASAPVAEHAASAPEAPSTAEIRVQRGDTLSRIAGRAQRDGVSLDQMLVGLYRANPTAFVDNNMNRLKSGVVLNVPSNEQLTSVPKDEAHRIIQAQSSDFNAYRQHLASAVPAQTVEKPQRKAAGQVQAEVQDRKQAAAPAPDKLTLSKGGVAPQGKASAAEDKLAKDRAQKDSAARVAELSKNVQELKKLQGAASGAASAPSAAVKPVAGKPAPGASVPVPAPVVASAPQVRPASAVSAASAPIITPPQAASVAVAASVPASGASSVDVAQAAASAASQVAPAALPAVVASRPVVHAPPPPPEEPGFLDGLMENPLVLPGVGVLVAALLGGFAFYKIRARRKTDSGETSFLESRLQPDSFFGASGGQRIDTRDASGAPSSMSYSLSQLDAIGDVDPVAEADVYLAYGRDLQAEEILKEAMRTTPERLAIRTKLLEVYAKRRDTKGFEQLATQLYGLTSGQGDEWAKAQELGLSIDPENPLYAPGGQPVEPVLDGEKTRVEPLSASTLPFSAAPSVEESPRAPAGGSGIDLDLDISSPGAFDDAPIVATQPAAPNVALDLPELTPVAAPAPAPASNAGPLEFDLGGISLDLGAPASATAEVTDLPDLDAPAGLEDGDPLARKIELAEEFRQIGDVEGARDLLQEVISKSSGALKTKAQSMLDSLS
jgi:pilus assembly protein FimV